MVSIEFSIFKSIPETWFGAPCWSGTPLVLLRGMDGEPSCASAFETVIAIIIAIPSVTMIGGLMPNLSISVVTEP